VKQETFMVRAVERVPVLAADECNIILDKVHSLEAFWIRRAGPPFFSLGAASYLDAQPGEESYYVLARRFNGILRENFGWLYDRAAAVLEKHLNAPIRYVPRFALPGFHIFQSAEAFADSTGWLHCDLQYQTLDWTDYAAPDFSDPLSFTLAVALPNRGGGLQVWNIEHGEIFNKSLDEIRGVFKSRESRYEAYRLGEMVVHSGHTVHQIAPMAGMVPGDERVTLQGHGIRSGDMWHLYW
jgi:hypothetical protein